MPYTSPIRCGRRKRSYSVLCCVSVFFESFVGVCWSTSTFFGTCSFLLLTACTSLVLAPNVQQPISSATFHPAAAAKAVPIGAEHHSHCSDEPSGRWTRATRATRVRGTGGRNREPVSFFRRTFAAHAADPPVHRVSSFLRWVRREAKKVLRESGRWQCP